MRGGQLVARAVLIGALAAGFSLGGCGRKGALDPPPAASLSGNQPVNAPAPLGEPPNPFAAAAPSEAPSSANAAAATPGSASAASQKTFILDWLLK